MEYRILGFCSLQPANIQNVVMIPGRYCKALYTRPNLLTSLLIVKHFLMFLMHNIMDWGEYLFIYF